MATSSVMDMSDIPAHLLMSIEKTSPELSSAEQSSKSREEDESEFIDAATTASAFVDANASRNFTPSSSHLYLPSDLRGPFTYTNSQHSPILRKLTSDPPSATDNMNPVPPPHPRAELPSLPLPLQWTAAHDRYICLLDVTDRDLAHTLVMLRNHFPELRGTPMTEGTIDKRLRALDQDVRCKYWQEAMAEMERSAKAAEGIPIDAVELARAGPTPSTPKRDDKENVNVRKRSKINLLDSIPVLRLPRDLDARRVSKEKVDEGSKKRRTWLWNMVV